MKDCTNFVMSKVDAVALFASFVFLGVVAVVGNLLIVVVVIKDPIRKLHTPFNYFLVNLSVCDFVTGTVPMPLTAYYMYCQSKGLHLTFSSLELCATITSACSIILSTCALAIDRLIGITYPVKYRQRLSWLRCIGISVLIWITSIVVGILVTFVGNQNDAFVGFYYSGITSGAIVITVVYFKVHQFLRSHEEDFKSRLQESLTASNEILIQKRCELEKKVTRAFLIILVVFVISYVPGLAFLNIMQYCERCSCQLKYNLYHIRYLLSVSNSSINPIMFIILLRDFRTSIKALFVARKLQTVRSSTADITTSTDSIKGQGPPIYWEDGL